MAYAHLVRHCLSQWITMILTVIAPRSKNTFVELLCGCMISPEGWVARVIGAITRTKHWTTYFKLIPDGHPNSPTCGHLKIPHPERGEMTN